MSETEPRAGSAEAAEAGGSAAEVDGSGAEVGGAAGAVDEAIRELSRRRAERIRHKELDEMVEEFYAAEALLLPAGRGPVEGIDAVREFWRETPATGLVSLSLHTRRVEGAGALAYEIGTFARTLRPRHGAPFQDHGKYLVVYRRGADGDYRAVAEIFNSDR